MACEQGKCRKTNEVLHVYAQKCEGVNVRARSFFGRIFEG